MTAAKKQLRPGIIAFKPNDEKAKKDKKPRNNLYKRGKYYHYRIMVNGELKTGSTKQEKKDQAIKELERIRQKLNHQVNGTTYIPLISEALEDWEQAQKADNHAEKHIANCSRLFKAHVIPIIGDIKLDKIMDTHIEKVKIAYLQNHTEHGTNTMLTYLKAIMLFSRKRYHILTPEIKKLKAQDKPIIYLQNNEVQTFLDEIDFKGRTTGNGAIIPINIDISFAVRAMIFMGLRENEVLSMKWKHLNISNKKYTLTETKGNESPTIDIPEEVMEWVLKLQGKRRGEYLIHQPDGLPRTEGYTSNPVRRASKRLGMSFGPHTLRKTHACLLAESGANGFEIKGALRHKSIVTSEKYAKVGEQNISAAQARMRDRLKKAAIIPEDKRPA